MQCSLSDCSTVGGLVWLIDFISHYCMGVDHFTSHRAIVRRWVQCVEESDLQMPKAILLATQPSPQEVVIMHFKVEQGT